MCPLFTLGHFLLHSIFLTGVRSLVCGVDLWREQTGKTQVFEGGSPVTGTSQVFMGGALLLRQIARYKHSSIRHHIHLSLGDISQNIPLLYND